MAPRKIGVLTFHKCINYGSYWQARCLVEGLRAQGHDADLLDHHCDGVEKAEARCAYQPKLPERTRRAELPAYTAKTRKFIDAIGDLPLSRRFSLHEPEMVEGYDAVVIGSDEVWNLAHPWYGGKPIFYGAGLKAPQIVSYAASFGNYSCHWGIDEHWAQQLKQLDRVSVRDDNSYWLVRGSTGREPNVVLDPCLLFPDPARSRPDGSGEPYALVYGHGFPPWLEARVRRWGRERGVRLVSVGYGNGFADDQRVDAGPAEFAQLMAGAQAVITNFFHGCVFALLNGKPFVTAPSSYRFNKVRDLMATLGAQHHMVGKTTDERAYNELLESQLHPDIHASIRAYRDRSNAYLHAALS